MSMGEEQRGYKRVTARLTGEAPDVAPMSEACLLPWSDCPAITGLPDFLSTHSGFVMAWSNTSRHARGYGAEWDKIRKRILERDKGLCQCERCQGGRIRLRPATEVDHKVSKATAKRIGWTDQQIDADDNLQAINGDCHKRKTAEEQGKRFRPAIGRDGWPVESD